ncbi:MAG: poly-gamma-glutamate system protein [Gammaproteobacteria bacterium]
MKKMYWQAHKVPQYLMIIMCVLAIVGMVIVEHYKSLKPQPYFKQKLAAAELASEAMQAIKKERLRLGYKINREDDPQNSGLVGAYTTVITSDHGKIRSKRATINPNIAALVVGWMKDAGLKKGDVVAVGMTGSFPALDICVLAAIKTLKLKPLIILSAGASTWGANLPRFNWVDMQHYLYKENIIPYQPIAASIGGQQDRGKNMPEEGIKILKRSIEKYGITFIDSEDTEDAIAKRVDLYKEFSKNKPIVMYINVGGGVASIGLHRSKDQIVKNDTVARKRLDSGLIMALPIDVANIDSVTVGFLKEGIPVINLHEFDKIATTYNLPAAPLVMPIVGSGLIFYHQQYNKWLATGVLVIVLLMLIFVTIVSRKYVIKYQQK